MIASSYNILGYNHANTDKNKSDENQSIIEKPKDLINLVLISKDHQKSMKKIHEIYDVLRPVILVELLSEAVLMSLIPFVILLNTNKGVPLTSPESIKFISGAVITTLHVFLTCYLFSQIDKYNDEINFALYSSNWTEMSIKFKKLLLLTMQINNANNFKLNVSTNIVVNLKLYTNVRPAKHDDEVTLICFNNILTPPQAQEWAVPLLS
ncbi:uncharacterized protein LOC111042928 [Myzus persicae]|uniref:uncharacterized protein LOC111042928 n=1 Tax=Myzus persicae TaxID=13164 RepID=UPI000B9371AB|nr:uncharacterized protein LOC111042928 [Myzus persicae]